MRYTNLWHRHVKREAAPPITPPPPRLTHGTLAQPHSSRSIGILRVSPILCCGDGQTVMRREREDMVACQGIDDHRLTFVIGPHECHELLPVRPQVWVVAQVQVLSHEPHQDAVAVHVRLLIVSAHSSQHTSKGRRGGMQ